MTNDSHNDLSLPLMTHLTELRDRLLRCVFAVLISFIILFYFSNDIYEIVSQPLRDLMPAGTTMIATEVASPFLTPFKLTLVIAFFLAMPYVLYQMWGFVAPGLYKKEKKLAAPLLTASILLFYLGILFAYFVVFPLIFDFFANIGPEGVSYTPDIAKFLDIVLKLFFAFGLAFQVPIATVLVIKTKLMTAEQLSTKRPYIIVGCFVFGMLLTPPDMISQSLLAIPMWFLFELGLIFGKLSAKNSNTETAEDN